MLPGWLAFYWCGSPFPSPWPSNWSATLLFKVNPLRAVQLRVGRIVLTGLTLKWRPIVLRAGETWWKAATESSSAVPCSQGKRVSNHTAQQKSAEKVLLVTLENSLPKLPSSWKGWRAFTKLEISEQGNMASFPCQGMLCLGGYRRALVHVHSVIGKKHLPAKAWCLEKAYSFLSPAPAAKHKMTVW